MYIGTQLLTHSTFIYHGNIIDDAVILVFRQMFVLMTPAALVWLLMYRICQKLCIHIN